MISMECDYAADICKLWDDAASVPGAEGSRGLGGVLSLGGAPY